MILRFLIILFVSAICFTGCKSKNKITEGKQETRKERVVIPTNPKGVSEKTKIEPTTPVKPTSYEQAVANYITDYGQIAKDEMLRYGIPASITLAQGILESGAGRGSLSERANNHFGIKCHRDWTGERVYHDDDKRQECFRKYKNPKYSFRDHSLFLSQRSRYAKLFTLQKDDYEGWAKGLKNAGYATDPKYPDKLISIINRYNLAIFDQVVLGKKANMVSPDDTKISTYTIVKGDTLYNIARRFNMSVDTLKDYNGLISNEISIGQELYLHPTKK